PGFGAVAGPADAVDPYRVGDRRMGEGQGPSPDPHFHAADQRRGGGPVLAERGLGEGVGSRLDELVGDLPDRESGRYRGVAEVFPARARPMAGVGQVVRSGMEAPAQEGHRPRPDGATVPDTAAR